MEQFQTKLFDNLQSQLDDMWNKKVSNLSGKNEEGNETTTTAAEENEGDGESNAEEKAEESKENAEVNEKARLLEDVRKQFGVRPFAVFCLRLAPAVLRVQPLRIVLAFPLEPKRSFFIGDFLAFLEIIIIRRELLLRQAQ